MKLFIEIQLGNEGMTMPAHVTDAIVRSFGARGVEEGGWSPLKAADEGVVIDANGNTVGRWDVLLSDGGYELQSEREERSYKANVARLQLLAHDARDRIAEYGLTGASRAHYEGRADGLDRAVEVISGRG